MFFLLPQGKRRIKKSAAITRGNMRANRNKRWMESGGPDIGGIAALMPVCLHSGTNGDILSQEDRDSKGSSPEKWTRPMETDRDKDNCREDSAGTENPCLRCGACCAAFRVSFYWAEGDDHTDGGVPAHLTVKVNAFRRAMRAAVNQDLRCIALLGTPGQKVQCAIYERRPSVCRNFEPSWQAGIHNPLCDRARAVFSFPPHCQS